MTKLREIQLAMEHVELVVEKNLGIGIKLALEVGKDETTKEIIYYVLIDNGEILYDESTLLWNKTLFSAGLNNNETCANLYAISSFISRINL